MEDENHQHVDLVDLSSNCVDLTTRKQIHNPSPSKKKTSSTYTRNLFVEDHGSKCTSHQSLLNQNGTSNLEFSSCKNSQGLSSESKRPAQTKTSIKSPQSLTGDFLSRSRSKIPRFLLNSSQYHSSLSESMCDDLEYLSLHQKPSSSFTNESFTSQRRSSNRKNTHQSERRQQRQQHSPNRSQYHEPISYVYSSVPRTPPSGSKHRRQLNGYRKNMANIDARLQELRNERANRPLPRSTRPRSGTNSTSGKHPTISQDSPSSSKNAHRPASHTEKPDTSRSNDSNYLQREFPNKCLSKDSLKCKNDSEDLSNPKGHDTPEDSAKYGSEDFSGAAVPQSAVVSPACQEVMLNLQGFRVADDTFLQDESWRNQSDSDSDVSDEDFVAIPPVDVEHDFDLPPIREENENAALFSHVQSSSDSAQTRQGGVFTVSSINQLADRNSSELPQRSNEVMNLTTSAVAFNDDMLQELSRYENFGNEETNMDRWSPTPVFDLLLLDHQQNEDMNKSQQNIIMCDDQVHQRHQEDTMQNKQQPQNQHRKTKLNRQKIDKLHHRPRSATLSDADKHVDTDNMLNDGHVDLVYDPSLNSYFNPITGVYFQLV